MPDNAAGEATFRPKDQVYSLPGCLAYLCGDRSGRVEKIDGTIIYVRMDNSRRVTPFRADQLSHSPPESSAHD